MRFSRFFFWRHSERSEESLLHADTRNPKLEIRLPALKNWGLDLFRTSTFKFRVSREEHESPVTSHESLLPHRFLNLRHRYRALAADFPRIAIQLHDRGR